MNRRNFLRGLLTGAVLGVARVLPMPSPLVTPIEQPVPFVDTSEADMLARVLKRLRAEFPTMLTMTLSRERLFGSADPYYVFRASGLWGRYCTYYIDRMMSRMAWSTEGYFLEVIQ